MPLIYFYKAPLENLKRNIIALKESGIKAVKRGYNMGKERVIKVYNLVPKILWQGLRKPYVLHRSLKNMTMSI